MSLTSLIDALAKVLADGERLDREAFFKAPTAFMIQRLTVAGPYAKRKYVEAIKKGNGDDLVLWANRMNRISRLLDYLYKRVGRTAK